jgi:hypothetical protein
MSMKMAAAKEAPRASNRLARLITGKQDKPIRVVLYGQEGCGKSTFASNAPAPIFLGAEDGTAHLDVARLPDINTWRDVLDALAELDSAHGFRTIVLDTADWIEPMIWDALCTAGGKQTIEDFGFGKGYTNALNDWRRLAGALDRLRERRGMNAIVLAHSHVKTFKNPGGEDFDRYEMKVHQKASGLLKEWCDVVLFAEHETFVDKKKNERAKGISSGARIIHTERTAAWDAKNRYDLPAELPLDWDAFASAVHAHQPAPAGSIEAAIAGLLEGMPADVAKKVREAMQSASGDPAKLAHIANKLEAMKSIGSKDQIAG